MKKKYKTPESFVIATEITTLLAASQEFIDMGSGSGDEAGAKRVLSILDDDEE